MKDEAIYAETKLVIYVAKNNKPFMTRDGFSSVVSETYSDGELAKEN